MSFKVCSSCKTKNDGGNSACVKCGQNLLRAQTRSNKKKIGNLYTEIAGRFLSFVLMICAIISVAMATMAVMNTTNPDFSIFSIYKTIE